MEVKNLSQAPKAKALNSAVIAAFFTGSDAQKTSAKVAAIEAGRLAYLFHFFPNTPTADVKQAVREYRKEQKAQAKGDKAKEKSIANRAREVELLYGGWKLLGLKPEGIGYHDAVAFARNGLKEKGLKWDGAKVPQKWERELAKETAAEAQQRYEIAHEIKRRELEGEEVTPEVAEEIEMQVAAKAHRADMAKLAQGLVSKYGIEKCAVLVEEMETAISAAQQEAGNKAAEAQQQAEQQKAA